MCPVKNNPFGGELYKDLFVLLKMHDSNSRLDKHQLMPIETKTKKKLTLFLAQIKLQFFDRRFNEIKYFSCHQKKCNAMTKKKHFFSPLILSC